MKSFKIKSRVFKSKLSDLKVDVNGAGWIIIFQDDESISLGVPPNARTELIKKAIEYVEKKCIDVKNVKSNRNLKKHNLD